MAKLVKPDKHGISAAAEHIQNNGVVIFPTETVFGIGASAYSKEGIQSIYRIKNRNIITYADDLKINSVSLT